MSGPEPLGRMTQFQNDGLTFDLRDEGPPDGPVVIALHGFPQTSASWRGVAPLLASAGYRVLAPDQRGYSPRARPKPIKSYILDNLAADVIALAEQAGAECFDLLGHDWGAAVAWHVAANYPRRVRTVTALSVPHPRAFMAAMTRGTQLPRSWYMLFFQIPWLPELLARKENSPLLKLLLRYMPTPEPLRAEMSDLMRDPRTARGAVNWYRAMRYPARPTGRVAVPALFVWSDKDNAVTRKSAELCGDYVDAPYRFETIAGAGHWIPHEHAEKIVGLMREHLAARG
jgi:pimeloyl-ACP methyl ester carboxylesterase